MCLQQQYLQTTPLQHDEERNNPNNRLTCKAAAAYSYALESSIEAKPSKHTMPLQNTEHQHD
jgi:hypothetical protein